MTEFKTHFNNILPFFNHKHFIRYKC